MGSDCVQLKWDGIIVVVWIVERSFMSSLFVHTRFVLLNNHSLSRLLSWTKLRLQSMVNHTLQVIMYFEHHHHYHISDSVCFPAWCLFPSLGFSVKSTKVYQLISSSYIFHSREVFLAFRTLKSDFFFSYKAL